MSVAALKAKPSHCEQNPPWKDELKQAEFVCGKQPEKGQQSAQREQNTEGNLESHRHIEVILLGIHWCFIHGLGRLFLLPGDPHAQKFVHVILRCMAR